MKEKKQARKVTFAEAIILLLVFVGVMIYGALKGGFPTAMSVLYCGVIAAVYGGVVLHWSWDEMFKSALEVVQNAMPAMYFLMLTGFVSAAWLASGTIPYMIDLGLKILSPKIYLFAAFIICWVASMATGSSWAIVSSVGLALSAIATGLGVPLPVAVGAIVSGCFLGDKWSPLSDTPNLAAAVNGQNIMKLFTNMLSTSGLGAIIGGALFLVHGFFLDIDANVSLDSVTELMNVLESNFNFNILLLIPLAFVIIMCILKFPPLPVVVGGVALGIVEAMLLQGVTFSEITNIVWSGYKAATGNETVDALLTRGGCTSLSGLLLLLFMAFIFAGVLNRIGVLDAIGEKLTSVIKGTGSLVLCSLLTSALGVFLSASVYVSIILNTQMYDKAYRKEGLDRVNLARTTLEASAYWGGMVAYSGGAVLVISSTGVAPWSYIPFVYACWAAMILTIIYGFTGKCMPKAKYDEDLNLIEDAAE